MIVHSTPGSIVWRSPDGRQITFLGEWTLEPKFYLDASAVDHWDEDGIACPITADELEGAVASLCSEAAARGWDVVSE